MLSGCAEVGAPPGGEPDVTGPRLLESYPPNGAVGVVPDSFIRLSFSERIVKPDQGSVVFISPRPSKAPEIKWEADGLLIKLPELFRSGQTYVVSVNTSVTDLRRNRLDSAITVAFSTGASLDSGTIAGGVTTVDSKPAVGWMVGLYSAGELETYALADSIYPRYVTTVGGDGRFSLRYLPDTAFDLLAFEDKNRDELFNPATEPFALPDRPVLVGGGLRLDNLILPGTTYDSLAPEILSVITTKDRLLRVRLNRQINPSYLAAHLDESTLRPLQDSGVSTAIPCAGLLETDQSLTDIITLYFPGLQETIYRLSLVCGSEMPLLTRDSVAIKLLPDDVPPQFATFVPGEKPLFVDQIKMLLTLSEPVKKELVGDQTLALWEGERRIPVAASWPDAFRLALTPEKLQAGRKYRLDITEFDFRDMSDNPVGDSLRSYAFSALDEDSVGSIVGQLQINLADKVNQPAVLTLNDPVQRRSFSVTVPPTRGVPATRDFEIKLPPGKYLLSGFLDQDGDGRPTRGKFRPLRFSETQAIYPDTIAVRARFESAGTQFNFE